MTREAALIQGLAIIDAQYKLILSDVNDFYKKAGLSGQLSPESKKIKETVSRIQSEFEKALDAEDWFATPQGIKRSSNLLALLIAYSIAATITQNVALTIEAKLIWNTQLDPQVCDLCLELEGQEFDPEGEIPPLPLHLGCRCYWSLRFKVK